MRNINILLILFFGVILNSQEIPPESIKVTIKLPVNDNFELSIIPDVKETIWTNEYGEMLNVFKYKYKVISSPASGQPVWLFEIPNGYNEGYKFSEIEYKPYRHKDGIASNPLNENWRICGLPRILSSWMTKICYEGPGLLPGDSIEFVFITIEIPDLSYWYAKGRDTTLGPSILTDPPGYEEMFCDSIRKIYYYKTPFGPGRYGKTTGPGPNPPLVYDEDYPWYQGRYPKAAYLHLQDRLMHCMRAGWIQDSRIKDHIWRNIWKAADLNSAGKLDRARDILRDLLTYLDRERNKKNRKITDEGYYTLYYRIRYVKDNMWYRP